MMSPPPPAPPSWEKISSSCPWNLWRELHEENLLLRRWASASISIGASSSLAERLNVLLMFLEEKVTICFAPLIKHEHISVVCQDKKRCFTLNIFPLGAPDHRFIRSKNIQKLFWLGDLLLQVSS